MTFQNGNVTLSGNLFLPATKEKVPAVVILHGSGPDDGLGYSVYAKEFSKAGIATLVYDKRGFGNSGGDWKSRKFELLAGDAIAAVKFLQNRPEIDSQKIGVWGISQGGWTVAYAAAHSKDIAFAISVSGNAVSPTQQEMWHKDNLYDELGYSQKARNTALKFWRLIFDWLVLVDKGEFPLPDDVANSEKSAASIGLNYSPLPDWEKVSQPVLLIHGEYDKLSPLNEAIPEITSALQKGGNTKFTFRVFPKSSHTITTNKTGLGFDWEDNFHPEYFKFTTDWIKSSVNNTRFAYQNSPLSDFVASDDFADGGKYGKLPFYGRTYSQLIAIAFFLIYFLSAAFLELYRLIWRKRRSATLGIGFSVLNLLILVGFFVFISQSVFPQGMNISSGYMIPIWQRSLPLFGNVSVILCIALIVMLIRNRRTNALLSYLSPTIGMGFVAWLYYWNLVGLPF